MKSIKQFFEYEVQLNWEFIVDSFLIDNLNFEGLKREPELKMPN